MRISTTMIMNSYADNLNEKYESINKYSNQLSTTMAYERGSEDPVAAMQTIKSCTEYTINEQNQTNETMASSWMSATESTLTAVNKIVTTAYEKAEEAANGTNSTSDYGNYAVAFKSYREELVSTLNTSYDGQYIFGESSDGNAPFKLGTTTDDGAANDGKLMYYNYNSKTPGYIPVSDINKTTTTTTTAAGVTTTTGPDYTYTKSGVTDDLTLTTPISVGTDKDFETSTSGLDVIISSFASTLTPSSTTVSGTTTNVTGSSGSGNIVDQLTNVYNDLTNPLGPVTTGLSGLITDTTNAQDSILKVKVAVGEKSSMLTQISSRLTDNETNLTSALANSMEVDSTQAIMKYNMAETVYKESMSMASTVLQTSLFDFLK